MRAAARLLEVAEADVRVEAGRAFVRGSPDRAVPFARIVQASLPTFQGPGAVEPGFEATTYQDPHLASEARHHRAWTYR